MFNFVFKTVLYPNILHSSVTILIIYVYALNRNKTAELYVPSTFQTSDIEILSPKLKTDIHLTKSPKRDHVYKLCLYMLEEHYC